MTISQLRGAWKIVRTAAASGITAIGDDDPHYLGKTVVITPERLWVTPPAYPFDHDSCEAPSLLRAADKPASAYAEFERPIRRLGALGKPAYRFVCRSGIWPSGSDFFVLDRNTLVMTWLDGGVLKLVRK